MSKIGPRYARLVNRCVFCDFGLDGNYELDMLELQSKYVLSRRCDGAGGVRLQVNFGSPTLTLNPTAEKQTRSLQKKHQAREPAWRQQWRVPRA